MNRKKCIFVSLVVFSFILLYLHLLIKNENIDITITDGDQWVDAIVKDRLKLPITRKTVKHSNKDFEQLMDTPIPNFFRSKNDPADLETVFPLVKKKSIRNQNNAKVQNSNNNIYRATQEGESIIESNPKIDQNRLPETYNRWLNANS